MTQPRATRASAPAPLAKISGTPPEQRNLRHADRAETDIGCFLDCFANAQALVTQLVRELDDQDTVLCHDANQKHEADLAIDVQACAGQQHGENGTTQSQRNGRHHNQRAYKAFELCCQHQKNDDDGKAEHHGEAA
jgi:hypothetical protein